MGAEAFDRTMPLILVDVTVSGVKPDTMLTLPMAVDTGAACTIIPSDVASALGYDPGGSPDRPRIITGSGVEYAASINVTRLQAIGEAMDSVRVLCHDLPEQVGIDGVLGMNFLRNFDVHILFSQGVIELRQRV